MAISNFDGNSNGKSIRPQDNLLLETSLNLTVAHHLMVSNLGGFANPLRRMVCCKGAGLYSVEIVWCSLEEKE